MDRVHRAALRPLPARSRLTDPDLGTTTGLRGLPGWAPRTIRPVSDPRLEIQMLHDRVMVAPAPGEGERRSSGGIVIPATAQVAKKLVWGEVHGTGQHVRSVALGDRVLYGADDHGEVEVDGRTFVVLRERDLHAVASPSEPSDSTDSSRRTPTGTGLYL